MFFWKFFRAGPTDWVAKIVKGKITRKGRCLSFYYIPDYSNIVSVPTGIISTDFHFEERSSDYQAVHIQGVLTWRIAEPEKASALLDYSVDCANRHLSEDPKKLEEKLQNLVAVLGRRTLKNLTLEATLKSADAIGDSIKANLVSESYLASVGIEPISAEILSVKPEPDVGRALESATRELILKQSDDATAQRRLSALENERSINEREANNQLAKEKATRSVAETRENHARLEQQHQIQMSGQKQESELQMLAQKQESELNRRAREAETRLKELLNDTKTETERRMISMQSSLELADKEKSLAESQLEIAQKHAEAEKAKVQVMFEALKTLSADQLQSLSMMGAAPGQTIATAFQKLAERAGVIGQLNITPDLLQSILNQTADGNGLTRLKTER
jgi:hypothetical protein